MAKQPEPDESGYPHRMGRPARSALEHAGYTRLEQLNGLRAKDILKLHGMGPKALGILREELAARRMAFAEE